MVNDFIGLCSSVKWMVVHLGPVVDGVGRFGQIVASAVRLGWYCSCKSDI
jgi:hypothetical protein